jgi:hypothetical protein
MIKNNFTAFILYIGINILIYSVIVITDSFNDFHITIYNLFIDIPLFLITLCLFIIIGRSRFLSDLGSKKKNFFSVSIIFLIGIIVMFLIYPVKDRMSPLVFYWGYTTPLFAIVTNLNIDYYFSKRSEMITWCIFSILPSLLLWVGLQWKVKKLQQKDVKAKNND